MLFLPDFLVVTEFCSVLIAGFVFTVHADLTNRSVGGQQFEEAMVHDVFNNLENCQLTDEKRDSFSRNLFNLRQFGIKIIGSDCSDGLLIHFYCDTQQSLESLNAVYKKGDLTTWLKDILSCFTDTGSECKITLSFEEEDYLNCIKQFKTQSNNFTMMFALFPDQRQKAINLFKTGIVYY